MLKKIKIYELFGNKNTIDIDFSDKVTIITGDNGCGKTTILNIINSIINKTYQNLFKYDFQCIKIDFNDYLLKLTKSSDQIKIENLKNSTIPNNIIQIIYKENDDFDFDFDFDDLDLFEECYTPKSYSSLYFPTYRRSEVELTNLFTNSILQPSLYSKRINNLNQFKNTVVGISNNDIREIMSSKWSDIKERESSILNSFISEMFLKLLEVKGNSVSTLDNIDENEICSKVKEIFERTLSIDEPILNLKLDSYVNQIKKAKVADKKLDEVLKGSSDLTSEELHRQLDATMEQIDLKRNVDYSLMQILKIIDLYEQKIMKIEDLKSPFKKLQNTLSEFMHPKKCEIIQGRLYFKYGDRNLLFDDLSAGEKQLVTMFIYIGLALDKDGIVLIDEPEISLHIKWQRKIISRLVQNRDDLQFIISTHSPAILSDFRNNISKIGEDQYE